MRRIIILALALLAGVNAAAQTPPPAPFDKFITSVWVPAEEHIERWASLGVDAAWYNEGLNPGHRGLADVQPKIRAAGMTIWRYPSTHMRVPTPDSLDTDGTLTALSLLDEPVLHGWTPKRWKAQADEFRLLRPGVTLIGNLEGDKFTTEKPSASLLALYRDYCSVADVLYVDWYPITRVRYLVDAQGKKVLDPAGNPTYTPYPIRHIGVAVEFIVNVTEGKKVVGAVIETSNQSLDEYSRSVNAAEFRGESWCAIIFGARSLSFFPERPGRAKSKYPIYGDVNDATTPPVREEMRWLIATLKNLSPILMSGGQRLKTTPAPFEAREWAYGGKAYRAVVNLSSQEAIYSDGRKYGPYEVGWYADGVLAWNRTGGWEEPKLVSEITPPPGTQPTTQPATQPSNYDAVIAKAFADIVETNREHLSRVDAIRTELNDLKKSVDAVLDAEFNVTVKLRPSTQPVVRP